MIGCILLVPVWRILCLWLKLLWWWFVGARTWFQVKRYPWSHLLLLVNWRADVMLRTQHRWRRVWLVSHDVVIRVII